MNNAIATDLGRHLKTLASPVNMIMAEPEAPLDSYLADYCKQSLKKVAANLYESGLVLKELNIHSLSSLSECCFTNNAMSIAVIFTDLFDDVDVVRFIEKVESCKNQSLAILIIKPQANDLFDQFVRENSFIELFDNEALNDRILEVIIKGILVHIHLSNRQVVQLNKLEAATKMVYELSNIQSLSELFLAALNCLDHIFDGKGIGFIARQSPWQIDDEPQYWVIDRAFDEKLIGKTVGELIPNIEYSTLNLGEQNLSLKKRGQSVFCCFNEFPHNQRGQVLIAYINLETYELIHKALIENLFKTAKTRCENLLHKDYLYHLAYNDVSLNIPNYNWILKNLEELSVNDRANYYLVVIDVDYYALMLSNLGDEFTMQLYTNLYRYLRDSFPKGTVLAKLNNSGFGLVISKQEFSNYLDRHKAEYIKLLVDEVEHELTTRISLVGLEELNEHSPNFVMRIAEAQIGFARANKTHLMVYSKKTKDRVRGKYQLLSDLRKAIVENHFFIELQPKVELATGDVIGFEALARWRNLDGKMISPTEFIPVAEAACLIEGLGELLFEHTLDAARKIFDLGFRYPIAFNLSAQQLLSDVAYKRLNDMIDRSGIERQYLEFEITEAESLKNFTKVHQRLQELMESGIDVSMDDFGTGYSSLSHIYRLSARSLKIDRVFVSQIHDKHLGKPVVDIILRLGARYGYKVFAEGIETIEQRDQLLSMNCLYGQGFLFAEPMPVDKVILWLKQRYSESKPEKI
ncbi:hypothetical protein MAH1_25730 [Sessilibacter sp. MAH1]